MQPLVSVIVPAYNHGEYIQQTIRSILHQTYREIELIIINDGSTDNTWDKIQQMKEMCEKRFLRTVFINQENLGICKTLNEAIKLSQGKYIKPIASDDYLVPTAIETFVSFFKNNPRAEIVFSDGFNIESDYLSNMELNKGEVGRFSKFFSFQNGNLFKRLLTDVFYLPSPAVCYVRSLVERLGYYDESLTFEDVDFFLRAARETHFYFINDELVYHRIHERNTRGNFNLLFKSIERLLSKYDVAFCYGEDNFFTLQNTLSKNLSYVPVHLIKEMSKTKKIVVWGAGSFFERYKENIPFAYIVDSNVESARNRWRDIELREPYELLLENKNDIFIVVCSSFYREIFDWLNQQGFKFGEQYI